MASLEAIVEHEIDNALAQQFPGRVKVESLALLGDGIWHTSGYPLPRLIIRAREDAQVDPEVVAAAQSHMEYLAAEALLSGVISLTGDDRPRTDIAGPDLNFAKHLERWAAVQSGLDADTKERALYAAEMIDILEPLKAALIRHSISFDEFAALDLNRWKVFINAMPTRRVDMHLHRQWGRNQALKAKRGDLNDWALVGAAVAYCDVVVTEKQLASLVNRRGLFKQSVVMSDLLDLPAVLES